MNGVVVERIEAVAIVRLNRPEKKNALDLEMRAAIASAVRELDADDSVRAIVLTGGEEVFAAGADLNLLVDKSPQEVAEIDLGQYWAPLVNCTKPLMAAVNGFALGAGCEMAMMCDFIICDESARFGQTECRVGIMPGAGGTQRLVRAVGKPMASLMLMTGELIDGARAVELGLAAECVSQGSAIERATKLAIQSSRLPPMALKAIKRVLRQGSDLPLDAALALENREFLLLFDTEDQKEGMRAFLEKRRPDFKGR